MTIISALLTPATFLALILQLPEIGYAPMFLMAIFFAQACIVFVLDPARYDHAEIKEDAIVFRDLGRIGFSEIATYNIDDYLKIRRRGDFLDILLQGNTKNHMEYSVFFNEFKIAIGNWRRKNINNKGALPRQVCYYGTWKARSLGVLVLVLAVGVITIRLTTRLLDNRMTAVSAAVGIIPLAMHLIFSRRQNC